jgi:hypothetical protein
MTNRYDTASINRAMLMADNYPGFYYYGLSTKSGKPVFTVDIGDRRMELSPREAWLIAHAFAAGRKHELYTNIRYEALKETP